MMMISKRCKKTNEPSQQILPTMQIIAQGILEYDIHICIVNHMHTYTSEMFLLLSYKKMKWNPWHHAKVLLTFLAYLLYTYDRFWILNEYVYNLKTPFIRVLTLRLVTNSLPNLIVFLRVVVILFIKKMWHCEFWHCKWAGPLFDGPSNSGRYTICRSGEGKVSAIVLILANTFGLVGTQPVKFVEISSLIGTTQVLWHKKSAKYISSNIPYPKTLTHKVYHKK